MSEAKFSAVRMNESKWSTINNRTFIPLNFDPSEIARILWRFFPLTLSILANSEIPEPMSNTLVVQITHTNENEAKKNERIDFNTTEN